MIQPTQRQSALRPKLTIGHRLLEADLDSDNDVDISLVYYQFLLDHLAVHLDWSIDQGTFGGPWILTVTSTSTILPFLKTRFPGGAARDLRRHWPE